MSSAEIERVCNLVEGVYETAAIAVNPLGNTGDGPLQLVLYAVLMEDAPAVDALQTIFQKFIKDHCNPLFGISDVVVTPSLPRTASNEVMRRLLRDQYYKKSNTTEAKL